MDEKQQEMWDLLCSLDAEKVLGLLTDWHGLQLLDDGFYGHLIDEGYIDEPEDEDKAISDAEDFDDFCSQYTACHDCPFENIRGVECEVLFERRKEDLA